MDNLINIVENGGATSAQGFSASGVCAGLKRSGANDMALIFSDRDAAYAGSFTSCSFKAAPVQVCAQRFKEGAKVRAVIVNSGNANACTGPEGYENAIKMCALTAEKLSVPESSVLVASTGRIGVQLPMDKISSGIELASESLSLDGGAEAAKAIMTTDTRSKECAFSFEINGKNVTLGGMTKGAGMIDPKMTVPHATMLAFITTDAEVSRELLAELLAEVVDKSFNCVTVDGDMSTNDTVILMANGASGASIEKDSPEAELFKEALSKVATKLAKDIVLDGEGVTKFVTVEVLNAATALDARLCADAVSNSLLCKTAWFGGDPNWGRVLAAAGYSGAQFDPDKFSLDYSEKPVVRNGMDAGLAEEELAEVVKRPEFTVKIDLNAGNEKCIMWTNDISYEYVKINADYHT
jgi:glutamate N-acetyltransferase/amino-acid N-acetyltransferase